MDVSVNISNAEVLQQSKKWINIAYICGMVCAIIPFGIGGLVNAILLYVAFSKLKQHNVQSVSHFAHLMHVQVLILLVTGVLGIVAACLSNPFILMYSGDPEGFKTMVVISWVIGIIAGIIGILAGYVGCVAFSALLKNPQMESQHIEPIRGLYMMMLLSGIISLASCFGGGMTGVISLVIYIPCFIYYRRLFKSIEAKGLMDDAEAQPAFDIKDDLLHPSLVEKGYFIAWGVLLMLSAIGYLFK